MLMRNESLMVETDSISFTLMYRCEACEATVQGKREEAGICCERCQGPLDEDDEIAVRLAE